MVKAKCFFIVFSVDNIVMYSIVLQIQKRGDKLFHLWTIIILKLMVCINYIVTLVNGIIFTSYNIKNTKKSNLLLFYLSAHILG